MQEGSLSEVIRSQKGMGRKLPTPNPGGSDKKITIQDSFEAL